MQAMKKNRLLVVFLSANVLHGCATLNKRECASANWQDIGRQDGIEGRQSSQLTKHKKSCAKYNYPVDSKAYHAGRDQGLLSFCTAKNGYLTGRYGREYYGVCSDNVESIFLNSYINGLELRLEELAIEQDQLSWYWRPQLRPIKPSKDNSRRAHINKANRLYSRQQKIFNERLEILGWIAKWSEP